MKEQFIVQEPNKKKREEFINYINQKFKLKNYYSKEEMIESNFPFVIDFQKKDFWVCESITCCACAAQAHKIISIKEFISLFDK